MVDSGLLKRLGATQVDDPLVFVVGSVCGGTGAGMFLDVGYPLTNLWKRKWTRFNTKVCALLALPSVFSDLTHGTERIRSNAYVSLKELDHFMSKDVYTDRTRLPHRLPLRRAPRRSAWRRSTACSCSTRQRTRERLLRPGVRDDGALHVPDVDAAS